MPIFNPNAAGGGIDASIGGNTSGALALVSSGTLLLAGGNNITLSQNGQSVTISAGAGGGGIAASFAGNTSGALALVSSETLILAGGNNVTLSQNGQSVTISGPNTAAQSVQTLGIYASSQTLGTSSSTYDARSLSIVGSGILSVGWSNSSLVLSVPSGGGAGFTGGISGGNTQGNTGTTSNEMVLAGGNNITLSGATGAGGMSITIKDDPAGTNKIFFPVPGCALNTSTINMANIGSTQQWFWPFPVYNYVSVTEARLFASLSMSLSSNSSYAYNFGASLGIFTNNASTLQTVSSANANFSFTNSASLSTANVSGLRALTFALNANLTPGDYWIGIAFNTTSANANWATVTLPHAVVSAFGAFSGEFGQAANNTYQLVPGLGSASLSGGFQTAVALNTITGSGNVDRVFSLAFVAFTA